MWPDGDIYNTSFDWAATGPDSLILEYVDGTAEDVTSIAFDGPDAWRGYSSTDGELGCYRTGYGDLFDFD